MVTELQAEILSLVGVIVGAACVLFGIWIGTRVGR